MKLDLQIVFRGIPPSEAVEASIRKHAAKLDEVFGHVMSCRVTVEAAASHKHQGKQYAVHIDTKAAGHEFFSGHRHEHEDVYVAIRDAFDAVRRRLEDLARKQRGQTKSHDPLLQGRIVRLSEDGFGFIEDGGGTEYYFDGAALLHLRFEDLAVGASVEFLADLAGQGPQAKRVAVKGAAGPQEEE